MAIDQNDPRVQEYLRQQEEESAPKPKQPPKTAKKPSAASQPAVDSGKAQRRLFKKTRAGVVLTRDEVKAIKAGRKKLRKELRERGLKQKSDHELTAASLGLYFDKKNGALLAWFRRHWLAGLIGLLAMLLLVLTLFSMVSHARGYFTINLTEGMFREGFTLSETKGFENPTIQLFSTPAEEVPCLSISHLPTDVDSIDGSHNENYFAYTWYLRNEGESTVDYEWDLLINAESRGLTRALWVALFEDGQMRIYAKGNEITGESEALPAMEETTRGYRFLPIRELAPDSDQFRIVKQIDDAVWWRVVPEPFVSDELVAEGLRTEAAPMDVHKYTVVMWLEGDDPDATDELINGHAGVAMQFRMIGDPEENKKANGGVRWTDWWDDLKFWDE